MKKLLYSLLALCTVFTLMFSSCDEIEGPYGVSSGTPIDTNNNEEIVRKVLIEEFTGHICQACPNAHREIKRLEGAYGDRIIALGIHAGFFARTDIYASQGFTYNFSCPEGIALATDFNVINQPFPKGMVNRARDAGSGNTIILDWGAWEDKVDELLLLPPDAGLKVTPSYNAGSNQMTAEVEVKVINELTDAVRLTVFFSEDSIVKPQKDGTTNVPDYVHRHVLRGSLNGTYGEDLGPQAAGATITRAYSRTLAPADAVASKIYLVAVLTNDVTGEVIQAEEVKLIQ
jgi:hypothetical protein